MTYKLEGFSAALRIVDRVHQRVGSLMLPEERVDLCNAVDMLQEVHHFVLMSQRTLQELKDGKMNQHSAEEELEALRKRLIQFLTPQATAKMAKELL